MSKFVEWWKTHRYEWTLTDEEEGLAILSAELAWDAAIDEAVKVADLAATEKVNDSFIYDADVGEKIRELK